MKLKLLVITIVLLAFSACTQKTCPTYSKSDVEKPAIEKTVVV